MFNTSNGLPNLGFQINLLEQLVQEGIFSVQDLKSSVVLVSVSGNDYSYYLQTHGGYKLMDWNHLTTYHHWFEFKLILIISH